MLCDIVCNSIAPEQGVHDLIHSHFLVNKFNVSVMWTNQFVHVSGDREAFLIMKTSTARAKQQKKALAEKKTIHKFKANHFSTNMLTKNFSGKSAKPFCNESS